MNHILNHCHLLSDIQNTYIHTYIHTYMHMISAEAKKPIILVKICYKLLQRDSWPQLICIRAYTNIHTYIKTHESELRGQEEAGCT